MTSLMTRSGADIYDVTWLDSGQLGRNGLLADMGAWLENDAELGGDIVFRDILLSGITEKGVFSAPIDFYLRKLFVPQAGELSGELPVENKRMTWREFFDKADGLDHQRGRYYGLFDIQVFMERFVSRLSDFIDETGNTENLNSGEMVSLLEECRDWRDMGLCADSRDHKAYYEESCLYGAVSLSDYKIAEMLCTLPEDCKTEYYIAAPMPYDGDPVGTAGNGRYPELETFQGVAHYGVNAGSPRAEAAQDFLRFLLSEEAQEKMLGSSVHIGAYGFRLPVNRAVFRGMVERDLERIQGSAGTVGLDFPGLIGEAEGTVDQIAYIVIEKPYYRTIIRSVAKDFFLDGISVEEAARQMSDKVGLYLKEQG